MKKEKLRSHYISPILIVETRERNVTKKHKKRALVWWESYEAFCGVSQWQ